MADMTPFWEAEIPRLLAKVAQLSFDAAERSAKIERLRAALAQLLKECVAAGFDDARDYNWPKSLKDARAALKDTI